MFKGSMVALVTPMHNNKVDLASLRDLVDFQIAAGTTGLIAAGTTGESGTLSMEEKLLVIKTVVDRAAERVPVIAGTAANATETCIALTKEAMELGADAALIMTPAYIKPSQEGLYLHYSTIAHAVAIPIILYNVPSRTGIDLLPETVARLAHISNIIGIKEAVPSMERLKALLTVCQGLMDIYSGDDPTAAQWMLSGAKGLISVAANLVPREMAKLCDAGLDGDSALCLEIHDRLSALYKLLFIETNPIPVKWALYQMGYMSEEIRLPLTPLALEYQNLLKAELKHLQLI